MKPMKKPSQYFLAFSVVVALSVTAILGFSAVARNQNLGGSASTYSITVNDGNCYGLPQTADYNDCTAWTDLAYAAYGDAAPRTITLHGSGLTPYDLSEDSAHPYGFFRKFTGTGSNFENFSEITGIMAVKVVYGTPNDVKDYFLCNFATSLTAAKNVADPTIVTAYTLNGTSLINGVPFYTETFVAPDPDNTNFFKFEGQVATASVYVCSITIYYQCSHGTAAASSSGVAVTAASASAGQGSAFSF